MKNNCLEEMNDILKVYFVKNEQMVKYQTLNTLQQALMNLKEQSRRVGYTFN